MNRRDVIRGTGAAAAFGLALPSDLPAQAVDTSAFHGIIGYLAYADAVADRLGYTDPALRPAYHKQVLMLLSLAFIEVFGTSVENPDWLPHIPFYLPWGSPNADDIYRFTPIDPAGSYRLSGVKGTTSVALVTMRNGGAHLGQINGRNLGEIDLNTVEADRAGNYSLIMSAAHPAGYAGLWVQMPSTTTSLLFRSRAGNRSEVDPVCIIERLDRKPAPLLDSAADMAHKLEMMAAYASHQNEFLLGYLNKFRARGGDKGFLFDDQSGYGSVSHQRVLMHLFTLAPDEALILESDVPQTLRYWSVQLYDVHFSALDHVYHQTAFNGEQARLDPDGRVRIVVSAEDPGVPNWLDTGGWPKGGMLWRWDYASSYPVPSVTKVKLAAARGLLPADTPLIDAEQRQASIAKRAAFYETRGR